MPKRLSPVIDLSRKTIANFSQNKPSLIAKDLAAIAGVPKSLTHSILLARGAYKWFSVRRQVIRFKTMLKGVVKLALARLIDAKKSGNAYQVGYWRGYLKATEEIRAELRAMCHSSRWQAPDFDSEAQAYLHYVDIFNTTDTEH